jgi:hypothetical protein
MTKSKRNTSQKPLILIAVLIIAVLALSACSQRVYTVTFDVCGGNETYDA